MADFTNLKFILRVVNLILVLICLVVWCVPDSRDSRYHENGMAYGLEDSYFSQQALYAFTVPTFTFILFVLVIAFLLDEELGKWTLRVILISGAVLFLVTGVIALINYVDQPECKGDGCIYGIQSIITAILCVIIGIIMIVDLLKSENIF